MFASKLLIAVQNNTVPATKACGIPPGTEQDHSSLTLVFLNFPASLIPVSFRMSCTWIFSQFTVRY